MLVSFHKLCYSLLILLSVVLCSKGDGTGCEDWTISGKDVCCKKCKPGNRMVKPCGIDPALLCTPCKPNHYTLNPKSFSCLKCTQCVGVQFTLKECNTMSDTVCGCKDGYLCGNAKCSYCVTKCGVGEEPQIRSCRKCPEGTFNDKIHSMCKKWKESCPDGQILKTIGNASRDHECISDNEIPLPGDKKNEFIEPDDNSLHVINREDKDEIKWIPVAIAGGVAMLAVLCIIASVISCVKARKISEKQKPDTTSDQEVSEDSIIMPAEQEACSYHHPEQEQGGSSESINTQDSESKLIV
ncbi:tumor necrosis factor receptor superfamily member 9a [Misgurnus anguillicaudatus]|uniref:tumor necrosis factor receptor superfamily member 9a n=1 Tax=Misgurnus anguillicaudatus TaxID=75329 RepID=UPI003CCF7818